MDRRPTGERDRWSRFANDGWIAAVNWFGVSPCRPKRNGFWCIKLSEGALEIGLIGLPVIKDEVNWVDENACKCAAWNAGCDRPKCCCNCCNCCNCCVLSPCKGFFGSGIDGCVVATGSGELVETWWFPLDVGTLFGEDDELVGLYCDCTDWLKSLPVKLSVPVFSDWILSGCIAGDAGCTTADAAADAAAAAAAAATAFAILLVLDIFCKSHGRTILPYKPWLNKLLENNGSSDLGNSGWVPASDDDDGDDDDSEEDTCDAGNGKPWFGLVTAECCWLNKSSWCCRSSSNLCCCACSSCCCFCLALKISSIKNDLNFFTELSLNDCLESTGEWGLVNDVEFEWISFWLGDALTIRLPPIAPLALLLPLLQLLLQGECNNEDSVAIVDRIEVFKMVAAELSIARAPHDEFGDVDSRRSALIWSSFVKELFDEVFDDAPEVNEPAGPDATNLADLATTEEPWRWWSAAATTVADGCCSTELGVGGIEAGDASGDRNALSTLSILKSAPHNLRWTWNQNEFQAKLASIVNESYISEDERRTITNPNNPSLNTLNEMNHDANTATNQWKYMLMDGGAASDWIDQTESTHTMHLHRSKRLAKQHEERSDTNKRTSVWWVTEWTKLDRVLELAGSVRFQLTFIGHMICTRMSMKWRIGLRIARFRLCSAHSTSSLNKPIRRRVKVGGRLSLRISRALYRRLFSAEPDLN